MVLLHGTEGQDPLDNMRVECRRGVGWWKIEGVGRATGALSAPRKKPLGGAVGGEKRGPKANFFTMWDRHSLLQ